MVRAFNPWLTGVNPAGDAGDTSPQYYYVLSDIAGRYWLPSVRSASSRFHSAIRRHQFASVRQADSRLTRLVPRPWTRIDATAVTRRSRVRLRAGALSGTSDNLRQVLYTCACVPLSTRQHNGTDQGSGALRREGNRRSGVDRTGRASSRTIQCLSTFALKA